MKSEKKGIKLFGNGWKITKQNGQQIFTYKSTLEENKYASIVLTKSDYQLISTGKINMDDLMQYI